jgi:hypothetical protein
MEEAERANVGNYCFTHREEEEEGRTVSDEENGNDGEEAVTTVRRRELHYSSEDIHLLASQVRATC